MYRFHRTRVIVGIAAIVLAATACTDSGQESTRQKVVKGAAAGVGSVKATNVAYAPDVQIIDRPDAIVVWDIDPDGKGYTLDGDAPGVSKLAVGQVMLVKDEAVGRVRQLSREGDRVHVRVDAVGITDVVRDGELTWTDAAADPAHMAVWAWNDPNAVTAAARMQGGVPAFAQQASKLFIDKSERSPDAAPAPVAARDNTVELRMGQYGMRARCVATAEGVETTFELARSAGQSEIMVKTTAKISKLSSSGSIRVANGTIQTAEFTNNVTGAVDLEVKVTKQDSEPLTFSELLNLPMEAQWPVYVGGVPFALVVNWTMLFAPAIAAGKADLGMKAHFDLGGSGRTTQNEAATQGAGSLTATTDATADKVSGTTTGDSGFVAALRPRFGFGIGGAGTAAFTDYVASVGFTSAGASAPNPCRQVVVVLTPRVGVEPGLLGQGKEFVRPTDEKTVKDHLPKVPGCEIR